MYKNYFKRIIDIIVASIIFLILSPAFIIVTILLAFANSGKPFFFQSRPGKDEKIFIIIKFKTMTDKCGADGILLPDSERMTKLGSFIRRTSFDEIPQLINVLKGELSLVGPRPLLERYLPLYNEEQARRHNVKPGITGWAQVNGRNAISWEKKFQLDVEYVDNISFLMDLKILILTVKKVFVSEGVNSDSHATMEMWYGNN